MDKITKSEEMVKALEDTCKLASKIWKEIKDDCYLPMI
jgi:hypothetical protein